MRPSIFVFGSNLAGIHGAGAAKYALNHRGAVWGRGLGLQGQSYAIPTKDKGLKTLPIDEVDYYISVFCEEARALIDYDFELTPVGTGLAGLDKKDIWASFKKHGLSSNVYLTSTWITDEPKVYNLRLAQTRS